MNTKYLPILLAIALSACGGGGSSTPAPVAPGTSPATSFPISGGLSAFSQKISDFALTAKDGTDVHTMQISYRPGSQQTFEGHLRWTLVRSVIHKVNGVLNSTTSITLYFDVSPYMQWGRLYSNGNYQVISNQQLLPSSATVGQSGPLDNMKTYSDSSKFLAVKTGAEVWSLDSNTATTAWACNNSTTNDLFDASAKVSASECFKIDQTGNVSAMKMIVAGGSQSWTFE